jgi:hypothetical protein
VNYLLNTGCGQPDAKGAKVARRTRKNTEMNTVFLSMGLVSKNVEILFLNFLVFFRALRATLAPFASRSSSPLLFKPRERYE